MKVILLQDVKKLGAR
ncbi:MAG: hypothetical protein KC910_25295, partial [Candidatus Eremiobacteraeota bacterium]|nr:hypothetical protein [Candidatus Eremiobacteraeota bacterium]